MGAADVIDDPADPRVADFVGLRDPDLRRRVERDGGFFVAESPLVIRTVVAAGRPVRSLLLTPHQHDALADVVESVAAPVYVAAPAVLRAVVGFDLHRGAVAAVDRWPLPPVASVLAGARRVAVLERVNDHENLGGIFRNAAAFGIDAVLLDTECSDPLYRRCVRVSIGHVCTVPWTRVGALDEVRSAGLTLVATTPRADAPSLAGLDWPERAAILFGAEGPGLRDASLAAADATVRIPMRPGVDSLNVAAATAVVFYAATAG